jgi:hypothetical protein
MQPDLFEEISRPENTKVEAFPWFYDVEPRLTEPDPERLRTSTAALRITLDALERTL